VHPVICENAHFLMSAVFSYLFIGDARLFVD
jgi:hypothetical protein